MYLGTPEVQSNQNVVIAGDSPAFENRCKPGVRLLLCVVTLKASVINHVKSHIQSKL